MNNIFFRLSSTSVLTYFTAPPIDLQINYVKLIQGNYEGFEFPVVFQQNRGKKITDILDTGFPGFYLLSNTLISILKDNGFTGWKTYPVRIYDKEGNDVRGFQGLSVTGSCGHTYYKESSIFEKKYVSNGPVYKFYKGEFVNEWDGSDFFLPENTIDTIVTKKVADELKKNKITNLCLDNLEDIERDVEFAKKTS